jgi:hypothetical protein
MEFKMVYHTPSPHILVIVHVSKAWTVVYQSNSTLPSSYCYAGKCYLGDNVYNDHQDNPDCK